MGHRQCIRHLTAALFGQATDDMQLECRIGQKVSHSFGAIGIGKHVGPKKCGAAAIGPPRNDVTSDDSLHFFPANSSASSFAS